MLFDEILSEMAANRAKLSQDLLYFAETDTLLFLPENNNVKETLEKANRFLETAFQLVEGIDVPQINKEQYRALFFYLNELPIKKFMIVYLVATELRSVLLAVLFVENILTADNVFDLAFYEELAQQNIWGVSEEIVLGHDKIKQRLFEMENYKNNENIFTH